MKAWPLILMLLIAVATVVFLFHRKTTKEYTEMDHIQAALKPLRQFKYIGAGSVLAFSSSEPKNELLLRSRYILYPLQLEPVAHSQKDTVLVIHAVTDTAASIVGQATVLWSATDHYYRYYLLYRP